MFQAKLTGTTASLVATEPLATVAPPVKTMAG
jgi:hypothetical protein